eukprot:TRINITY_DN1360_c0_g1_i3.p1 TRINITY_DN1360_c0_g1~~TRINITY_DN1360_c0_g1_i3.p1  ORF type:complete len:148 (+),score=27.44 TRINITY_DN1360_c0_g1_i3:213-656(+)
MMFIKKKSKYLNKEQQEYMNKKQQEYMNKGGVFGYNGSIIHLGESNISIVKEIMKVKEDLNMFNPNDSESTSKGLENKRSINEKTESDDSIENSYQSTYHSASSESHTNSIFYPYIFPINHSPPICNDNSDSSSPNKIDDDPDFKLN